MIVEVDKKEVRINEAEILFIRAFKDYMEIQTTYSKFLCRTTMKKMEAKLTDNNFIRVHRSFLVQKDKIDAISKEELTVNQHKIPIGITYQTKIIALKKLFARLNK